MEISQIDALVHPLSTQDFRGVVQPHPVEAELRRKWNERVHVLAENPSAILFYFPGTVSKKQVAPEFGTRLISETQIQEMQMIEEFRKILGERFIIFPYDEETYWSGKVPARDVQRILKERGFHIDKNNVKVDVYGESMNACVEVWGQHMQEVLKIPSEQIHYDEDLSITIAREDEIYGTGWLK